MSADIFRVLTEATAPTVGDAFFRSLVRHLALALGVRYAFIAELEENRQRVTPLAFWAHDRFIEVPAYDLRGTPCEAVLGGETCCYTHDVQVLFPRPESGLEELDAESYLAIPLKDRAGVVMGHLAAIDTKPMRGDSIDLSVFQILAARASVEMERLRVEAVRRANEQRLRRIFTAATDAIVSFDAARRITFFNAAAERIFRCAAAWALGQPFDRFLTRAFRDTLATLEQAAAEATSSIWHPHNLTALRANGAAFPCEATLSRLAAHGEPFYTVILRDMEERWRAEQELARLGG